ncbi:hypothetical protein IQ254_00650 [Nodosilinea sp. LEGE 07088]|uniref:hypothetical protein n=1 Tax=Nodosilinea sp. LEGE 07088 TaxID=2777968 RepID=UPI001881973A|nr:hypothetical protein [Nodosilinea sp. LEGE 07088]MBE9135728.1 hypothetical protein [Nodosilinea sp. LEGE 07088]
MIPNRKDLLLSESLDLYDNLAVVDEVTGRLNAKLQIYPSAFIEWDFELFADDSIDIQKLRESFREHPLTAPALFLEDLTQNRESYSSVATLLSFAGRATKLVLGNKNSNGQSFNFLLTNTKVLSYCLAQDILEYKVIEKGLITPGLPAREIASGEEGKFIDAPLDSNWNLRLEIRKEAMDWLDDKRKSIGSYLTCEAELYQPRRSHLENWESLEKLNLEQSEAMIQNISWLLSYANCGFVAPLYIEAKTYQMSSRDTPSFTTEFASFTTNLQTTSLELLGQSWFVWISDLKALIGCFPAFRSMLSSSGWRETFYFVLIQYFQATRFGDWQIAASAAGAALERLSYQVLVEDEVNPTSKSNHELLFAIDGRTRNTAKSVWNLGSSSSQQNVSVTTKRLMLTLERIGLTATRGHTDANDVLAFLNVRNDAVHPRVSTMDTNERIAVILKAIQWIDEILLWRLGYEGKYLDRIAYGEMMKGTITSHTLVADARYDLTLRDASW